MSLADKLNYLKATKGLIKTAINNKGGNLTDDSSFRSYAEAIDDIGSTLTAEAEDILAGKTALSNDGLITGTSDKNATIGNTYTISGGQTNIGYIPTVCKNIEKIDMTGSSIATSVSMNYYFAGCSSLKSITNFPLLQGNATEAKYMFFICTQLTAIPQLRKFIRLCKL